MKTDEWLLLHSQYENYEKWSLVIKLMSVFVTLWSLSFTIKGAFVAFLLLVLWLQDGIWKTFQQRLEARLVLLESAPDNTNALYSDFQTNRPGTINLVKEYLSSSLRPTVAYPYAALILFVLVI
jgi:hypothetical protein